MVLRFETMKITRLALAKPVCFHAATF